MGQRWPVWSLSQHDRAGLLGGERFSKIKVSDPSGGGDGRDRTPGWSRQRFPRQRKEMGCFRLQFIVNTWDLHLPGNQEESHNGTRGLASHLAGTCHSTDCLGGTGFLGMKWMALGRPRNKIILKFLLSRRVENQPRQRLPRIWKSRTENEAYVVLSVFVFN